MLLRCVWYFDFACFNMTVVKNFRKKYPFMMYFQNAYAVLVLHNFFCSGNSWKNDGPLSKIHFLCCSVFLSLNNPSHITIREFSGSSFY